MAVRLKLFHQLDELVCFEGEIVRDVERQTSVAVHAKEPADQIAVDAKLCIFVKDVKRDQEPNTSLPPLLREGLLVPFGVRPLEYGDHEREHHEHAEKAVRHGEKMKGKLGTRPRLSPSHERVVRMQLLWRRRAVLVADPRLVARCRDPNDIMIVLRAERRRRVWTKAGGKALAYMVGVT